MSQHETLLETLTDCSGELCGRDATRRLLQTGVRVLGVGVGVFVLIFIL